MRNAGFRLTCRLPHCRYAAWSSLAVSELQLSAATPLWLYHRAASLPSCIEFNGLRSAAVGKAARLSIYWLDAACRLVISLRQVALAQLYKNHHQSGNAASGKLVWKQHKGATIFFGREGGPKFTKKVGVNKIATPLFRQQNFMTPDHDTPYPLNRLSWLTCIEINLQVETHYLWSWSCDFLQSMLFIKNFMTPFFSFQKIMTPQCIWDSQVLEKMIAPNFRWWQLDKTKQKQKQKKKKKSMKPAVHPIPS